GKEFRRVDDHTGRSGLHCAKYLFSACDDDVAADNEIRAAGSDADRVDFVGRVGDADMTVDGAALLREPGHVDHANALSFEVCGHADDGAYRDNAGAAHARYDDPVGMIDQRYR